jgi:hypothetical protein
MEDDAYRRPAVLVGDRVDRAGQLAQPGQRGTERVPAGRGQRGNRGLQDALVDLTPAADYSGPVRREQQ